MTEEKNLHYSAEYFNWQRTVGAFGGEANRIKFAPFIKPTDFVIDFGAGGGFLLNGIKCAKKLGVEINPSARENAKKLGVPVVEKFSEVESNSADIVISNHALEHVDSPVEILKEVLRVLKPGGKAVFVVPCEAISYKWFEGDGNFHLYTWCPMNLGNLFTRAGFKVMESKPYMHRWPRYFQQIQKLVGWSAFHFICRVYSHLYRTSFQVRCIAVKQ